MVGAAAAQPRQAVVLHADGCPSAALVHDMLAPLLDDKLTLSEAARAGEAVEPVFVRDLGDRYSIEVHGAQRTQHDPAADCKERARVAAVFIALNLSPLAGPSSDNGPAAAPPPLQVQPDAAARSAADRLRERPTSAEARLTLGLSILAAVVYAPEAQRTTAGGSGGLWLRWQRYRLELSAGGTGKVELPLSPSAPGGKAELLRVPFTITASVLWRVSRFELGPSLGLALDLLRLQGAGLAESDAGFRLNAGGYLGLNAHLLLSGRVSLVGAITSSLFPSSYTMQVEPAQRSATTPHVWLSAQLGLACMLR